MQFIAREIRRSFFHAFFGTFLIFLKKSLTLDFFSLIFLSHIFQCFAANSAEKILNSARIDNNYDDLLPLSTPELFSKYTAPHNSS